jgi:hypothetical protein
MCARAVWLVERINAASAGGLQKETLLYLSEDLT